MPIRSNRGDIARALADQFGLKGVMPMMVDEIAVPVVLVGDVRPDAVDPTQPGADKRCVGLALLSGGGVGGERMVLELQNPSSSQRLVALDRIFAEAQRLESPTVLTGQFINAGQFNAVSAVESRWFRDTRLGSSVNPSGIVARIGAQASFPSPVIQDLAYLWTLIPDDTGTGPEATATFVVPDLEIVLRPGTGFRVALDDDAIATDLGVTFQWRERAL